MLIDDGARKLLLAGAATVVATRDDRMRPWLQRGWAVVVSADGREVTVCVPAAPGSRMRGNLESNGAVAITWSRPTTYRTVQVKGEVVAIREPTPEQRRCAGACRPPSRGRWRSSGLARHRAAHVRPPISSR